ncbi:MAG: Plug domain-containing protein [Spirochaetia bacterium]|nr:Plug domain-containing protein [Spirochaetia bacterium]
MQRTTAELVNKAIGTTFNSYGALGSLQNVQIRGIGSSKVSVYLDGAPSIYCLPENSRSFFHSGEHHRSH